MAGPGRALPDGAGHGRLRASHADRDGVISTLKSAYVLGFVAKDEFDVRVGQALTARTYAELAVVTADLPAWLAAAQAPPGRAAAAGSAPARAALRPAERAVAACALFAAVAFAAAFVSDVGWLALAAVGSALASLIVVAVQVGATRRPRQPGSRRPGIGAGSRAGGTAAESPRAIRRAGWPRPPAGRAWRAPAVVQLAPAMPRLGAPNLITGSREPQVIEPQGAKRPIMPDVRLQAGQATRPAADRDAVQPPARLAATAPG